MCEHPQAAMSEQGGATGHSCQGKSWASASSRNLARRRRRVVRSQVGASWAEALHHRSKHMRQALSAHWELTTLVGAHAPSLKDEIAAAQLVGLSGLDYFRECAQVANWAKHAPPPLTSSLKHIPQEYVYADVLEEFRANLVSQKCNDAVEGHMEIVEPGLLPEMPELPCSRGHGGGDIGVVETDRKPADEASVDVAEDNALAAWARGDVDPSCPSIAEVGLAGVLHYVLFEESDFSGGSEQVDNDESGETKVEEKVVDTGMLGELAAFCGEGHPLVHELADGEYCCDMDGCDIHIFGGQRLLFCALCDFAVCEQCYYKSHRPGEQDGVIQLDSVSFHERKGAEPGVREDSAVEVAVDNDGNEEKVVEDDMCWRRKLRINNLVALLANRRPGRRKDAMLAEYRQLVGHVPS